MPLVTVLMAVKNGEATLNRSVNSILNQKFTDFEFLIIDDYSTDGTNTLLTAINDHRVKILKAPESGLVNALNYGLNQSKGIYIARMDADDISHYNRLELQVNLLNKETDIGVVSGLVKHVPTTGKQQGYATHVRSINTIITPKEHYANRFKDAPLANPSAMFRKSLLKYGNYKNFEGPEDYEFWLRLMQNGVRFKKLEEPVLDWYDYSSRLTRTDSNYSFEAFAKVKAEYFAKWWNTNNRGRSLWIWGYGKDVFNKSKWLSNFEIVIEGYLDIKERPEASSNVNKYSEVNLSKSFILVYVSDREGQKKIKDWFDINDLSPVKDYYFMT